MEHYASLFDLILHFGRLLEYFISPNSDFTKKIIVRLKTEFMSQILNILRDYEGEKTLNALSIYYNYGKKEHKTFEEFSSLLLKLKFLEIGFVFVSSIKKNTDSISEEINTIKEKLDIIKKENYVLEKYFDNIEKKIEELFSKNLPF